jgi:protein-tyrosine phosphatase
MEGSETHAGADLGIVSLPNLRDLGGYPSRSGGRVRTGLVYRSTELSGLEGDDEESFARLGVRTVFDLRTEGERCAKPDRLPAGTDYVVADVLRDSIQPAPAHLMAVLSDPAAAGEYFGRGPGKAFFVEAYREFVCLGSARSSYRAVFSGLARPEHRPVLFHCSTGKDRTGWAAAALLLFLDVAEEDVLADYLLSSIRLGPSLQPFLEEFRTRGGDPDLLRPILDVRTEYLESALDEVRRLFGTIEGYFRDGLGLRDAECESLRAALLEPRPAETG